MGFFHLKANDMLGHRFYLRTCLLTGIFLLSTMAFAPSCAFALETADPYQAIDQHALSVPASAERSIASLAAYLSQPANSNHEKARALYRWITANIVYDTRGFFSGQVTNITPQAVLRSRSSVCQGFADLFQALAQSAGLHAVTIKGYAKGYGYLPGTGFRDPANHTWNAVNLDGKWYLLDATMGSGYLNSKGQLIRQFRSYYFLTPPEAFIYDHFPLNARWQLLATPLPRQAFEELVWVKQHFFNHNLRLLSHTQATIETDNQVLVTLQAPEKVLLLARLEMDKQKLDERYTFVQKDADKVNIHVKLPHAGQYRLRIYAKDKGLAGNYKSALDYAIQASKGSNVNIGFPKTFAPFNDYAVYLHHPMNGYLRAGQDQNFKLEVPDAEKIAVVIGSNWYYLHKTGAVFEGPVLIPNGVFGVFAKFPGQDKFHGLLEFNGI